MRLNKLLCYLPRSETFFLESIYKNQGVWNKGVDMFEIQQKGDFGSVMFGYSWLWHFGLYILLRASPVAARLAVPKQPKQRMSLSVFLCDG